MPINKFKTNNKNHKLTLQENLIIGANLKKLREFNKWTQPALAGELGVTFQQLQKYENGLNRVSLGVAHRIRILFNVEMEVLERGL